MIELEIIAGIAQGKHIRTNVPFLSVGRAAEHTIVIDDPFVSRHHGEIMLIDSGYQYRDLNSTHGTILHRQGEQDFIRQVILRPGDELSFGGPDNLLRIMALESEELDLDEDDRSDPSITRMHVQADRFAPPEDLYANDSNALRTMVAFDSRIIESNLTTERQLFRALLEHIPLLFDRTIYVAIIEQGEGGLHAFDYELVDPSAKVRLSSTIISMSKEVQRGIVYNVDREEEVVSGDQQAKLSQRSRIMPSTGTQKSTGRSGICVPVKVAGSPTRYLQFERNNLYGAFRPRHVGLVSSMVLRACHRLENIDLVQKNQRLNHTASLGMFAGMIGHDIKNYLFYSKKLSEIRDDPLSDHPAIAKGIERSRKLAEGMKVLAAPGKISVKTFSIQEMIGSMNEEFSSLFGARCAFEMDVKGDIEEVTTSEDLLSRVIWNLMMNAYHASENRPRSIVERPMVGIEAEQREGRVRIRVLDNAGGIGAKTFEYIERSFDLIRRVYTQQEDLIDIVSEISSMKGFTNSIGLFFTAVAANDMAGTIQVEMEENKGSVFTVEIPVKVDQLRNLLLF